MKKYSFLAALLLAAMPGCAFSSEDASSSSNSALADNATCTAQSGAFDKALGNAIKTGSSYDVVMETITPDCGETFHTAGPSHLGADRLVRIGSMTKTFVSVVTLQLAAEAKINLDARLDTYLPNTNAAFAPATIRQLLQHTSGIASYTDQQAFWDQFKADPKKSLTPEELLAFAAAGTPTGAPGAGWAYSNTNYILLGQVVEAVAQHPIASEIRTRILTPNQLTQIFFDGEEPLTGELAPGLDENGKDIGTSYSLSWAWSAGAIVATPHDLARFIELLGTGKLLSAEMQTQLTTGVAIPNAQGLTYGLGVFLADGSITGGMGNGIGHGGDIMGYHSWGMYFPDKQTTIAGTVDSDKGNGNDILVAGITALTAPPPAVPTTTALKE
jgi:D-alanyl-D-alanine carboxypeptidase